MYIKKISYIFIGFLLVSLIQSCNLDDVSRKQNGLIFCVSSNIAVLDPHNTELNVTSATLAKNVFNRLIAYNPEKNQYASEIASSWIISQDRMTYTFKLHHKVSFHTTKWFKPTRYLNADDVVFSFRRLMSANSNDKSAVVEQEDFEDIDLTNINIVKFKHLVQFDKVIRRIKKIDDYTVSFTMRDKSTNFLELIANPNTVIHSKEYFDSLENEPQRDELFASRLVGTGPFQLVSHMDNDYIKLEKNPTFWQDPRKPHLEKLVIDITPNTAKRMNKIITNECQIANQPNIALMGTHERIMNNYDYLESNTYQSMIIYFNTQKEPLKNIELRRALAFAFNRDMYRRIIFSDSGEINNNLLPLPLSIQINTDFVFGYSKINAANFVERFKRTHRTQTVPTLTVWIEKSNSKLGYNSGRVGQLIKRDLREIGIRANIIEMSPQNIRRLLPYNGYDIIVSEQAFTRLVPMYRLYHNFICNSKSKPALSNYASYCNQELIALIKDVQYAPINENIVPAYNRIHDILLLDVPYIPIAYSSDSFIYNKEIQSLKKMIFTGLDFSSAYFSRADSADSDNGEIERKDN